MVSALPLDGTYFATRRDTKKKKDSAASTARRHFIATIIGGDTNSSMVVAFDKQSILEVDEEVELEADGFEEFNPAANGVLSK